MKIDTLFMDHDKYLITIDDIPIGVETVSIGEILVIKAWLRKNAGRLQSFFEQKSGWEILEEMKLWNETRRDRDEKT